MRRICIFLCLIWFGVIFYMSSNNGQISHGQSTKVISIIENTKSKLQSEFGSKTNSQLKDSKGTDDNQNIETNNESQVNKNTANLNELDYIIRKNAHGFLYMTLAIFVGAAIFSFNKKGKDAIIYILFVCLFYAVTDEFHQSFVLGRTSLVSDILVDFMGSLIGLFIFYLLYYKIFKVYERK